MSPLVKCPEQRLAHAILSPHVYSSLYSSSLLRIPDKEPRLAFPGEDDKGDFIQGGGELLQWSFVIGERDRAQLRMQPGKLKIYG